MFITNRIIKVTILIIGTIFLLSGCGLIGQNISIDMSASERPSDLPVFQHDPSPNLSTVDELTDTPAPQHDPQPDLQSDDETPDPQPEDTGEWKIGYHEILSEIGVSYSSWADIVERGISSVSFKDLTNDGTPELIFTYMEGGFVRFTVYGFWDGQCRNLAHIDELVRVASVEHYEAYSTHDGALIVYGSAGGLRSTSSHYHIFDDLMQPPKETTLARRWVYGHLNAVIPEYLVDGSVTTEELYNEHLEQIYDGAATRLVSDGFAPLIPGTADASMSFREGIDFLEQSQ